MGTRETKMTLLRKQQNSLLAEINYFTLTSCLQVNINNNYNIKNNKYFISK